MKTKQQKIPRKALQKKTPLVGEAKRSAPSLAFSRHVRQPRRKWRKPISYFVNPVRSRAPQGARSTAVGRAASNGVNRLFNFDPYRDFGILDELTAGLFIFMLIATTVTIIFGKEINTAWVDTSDADWGKGTKEHVEIVGAENASDIRLEGQEGGWTIQQRPTAKNITAITMLSPASGWAVGEEGMIMRTSDSGATWENIASTTQDNLWSAAFVNATLGFAVGDNGTILEWNGAWKAAESPTVLSLLGVALAGTQKGVAVGEGGTILEWNGSSWSLVDPSPTDKFLSAVTLTSGLAFAVGEGGEIVKWDGEAWSVVNHSLTTKNFLSVKLFSPSFGVAVGEGGIILHWNGSSWSKKKDSGSDLNSIAITSGSNAVAAGSDGTIVRWDGSAWNTENAGTGESVLSISAPTASTNIAVGSAGFVATYRGITYAQEGTYESATKDAEKKVTWDTIQWNKSGTGIQLQIAANNDGTTWDYAGPDGSQGSYYTNNNGQAIQPSLGKKRYLRYRAFFTTNNLSTTPALQAVTINAKEEIADEPPPEKKEKEPEKVKEEPTPVEKKAPEPPPQTKKQAPPPPSQPTQQETPTNTTAPTTPGAPEAPATPSAGTGGGTSGGSVVTQRVIAPQLTEPTTNALLQVELLVFRWEPTDGTTSYTLQVDRTTSFSSPVVQTTVAAPSYTHATPLGAGSYFWRVLPDIAATPDRRGDWSPIETFTLTDKPPLPKIASATLTRPIAVDSGTVTLEGVAFPHATVRVIITSTIVEKTVVADENGAWQIEIPRSLFASGQHLAQAQIFTKEGQVTPAVTIGEFFIPFPPPPTKSAAVATARAIGATATKAADATKKAAKKTVEETVVVAEKTQIVIKENETETKVVLSATVPIVTIANPTVLPALSNLHLLFYHFLSGLLSLFGIKKKRRPWGIVYDAITKEPIGLAIIRLFDAQKKLIETQVTDNEGRFGFLVKSGSYSLEVVRQDYTYPSVLVTGKHDGDFTDCYHNEVIALGEGAINVSIPLDPVNAKEVRQKQPLLVTIKSVLHALALPLLIIGWAVSWLTTLFAYSTTNLGMTGIYFFFAIVHVVLLPKKLRPWGTVFAAASLEPVPLAVISIIDTKFNRVLKSRLTDYSGRFNFLPPAGEYKLTVKKEGFDFPAKTKPTTHKFKNLYYGQNVIVKKEKAIVATDVPVERRSL